MKKKTLARVSLAVLFAFLTIASGSEAWSGAVKTKDEPEKCGGYHNGSYHLKCKNEKKAKKGYVDRDHKWKNPFSGFTKGADASKPKKQSEMPHSR